MNIRPAALTTVFFATATALVASPSIARAACSPDPAGEIATYFFVVLPAIFIIGTAITLVVRLADKIVQPLFGLRLSVFKHWHKTLWLILVLPAIVFTTPKFLYHVIALQQGREIYVDPQIWDVFGLAGLGVTLSLLFIFLGFSFSVAHRTSPSTLGDRSVHR